MGIISRLKNLRDRLRKEALEKRKRNDEARKAQKRRRELLEQKRERREVLRRRVNSAAKVYNALPSGVDEEEAHRIKTKLVDARREFREISDEIDDVVSKIERVTQAINKRGHQATHALKVRIPHISRRIKRKKKELADRGWSYNGGDIVTFDGKPTVEWLAYRMEVARAAGWGGYLVSGYRTPEYSIQLCYNMCGAPSCPGRCAGAATNHAKKGYGGGAIDVSDYYTFGSLMRTLPIPGIRIFNALGAQDPVHFSASGR